MRQPVGALLGLGRWGLQPCAVLHARRQQDWFTRRFHCQRHAQRLSRCLTWPATAGLPSAGFSATSTATAACPTRCAGWGGYALLHGIGAVAEPAQ